MSAARFWSAILLAAFFLLLALAVLSVTDRYQFTCSTSNGYRCIKVDTWTGRAYLARDGEWKALAE